MIEHIEVRPASLDVLGDVAYSTYFGKRQQRLNIDSYERIRGLLEDLGLDPDRKYTVAEITLLRDVIAFTLGSKV